MNNETRNIPDFQIASFLQRLEAVGYASSTIAKDLIVWVAQNISCAVVNKDLKRDAELAFNIDGIQQFSLYYQILVNKLFFVVTQEDSSVKEMIDERLVPLFEERYRKKFIANNLRKKDRVFWIDIEQLSDTKVFDEMTRIIGIRFVGCSPETALQQSGALEDSAILPSKEDFEAAYRMLARPGESISIDAVLDQIEINAKGAGRLLKSEWRMITETNIEIWSRG